MKAICEVKPKEKIGLAVNIPNCEIGFNALVTIDWSEDIRPNFEKKGSKIVNLQNTTRLDVICQIFLLSRATPKYVSNFRLPILLLNVVQIL
jgi:hypothetical protein